MAADIRTVLPEVECDVSEVVAGAEGRLGAVEGEVAEVVQADSQVAVFTTQRIGGVWGNA